MTVGTYLTLWHGRKSVDENLSDWGSNGPTFGPFEEVTITYASHVKCATGAKTLWFNFTGDVIEFDGVYYGDFTIFAGIDAHADAHGTKTAVNPCTKIEYKITPLDKVAEKYFG